MNMAVIKSAWRRWQSKRPSAETLRALRNTTNLTPEPLIMSPAPALKRPNPHDPPVLTTREAQKYALQNLALLTILRSHALGKSTLSPEALASLKQALGFTASTLK